MSSKKFVKVTAGNTGRYWWINADQVTVIASNGDGCKVFYAGGHLDLPGIDADTLTEALEGGSDREQRIEQAAQVMSENADRGVASMPWESMPDSIREQWRQNARALEAAGLLRGGGRGE